MNTENKTMQMIGSENINIVFRGDVKEQIADVFESHKGINSTDLIISIFMLGYIHGKREKNVQTKNS